MDLLDLLARCYPFHQIDKRELEPLLKRIEPRQYKRGQTLLRRGAKQEDKLSYLVAGSAELRRSFFDRTTLQVGEEPALQPLDYLLLSDGGQIVALEDCSIVQVARDLIDRSMAANGSGSREYGVASLQDAEHGGDFIVSDSEVAVDWMSRFLQSPLAQHLPAVAIQQLLACLSTEEVQKDYEIVRRGEAGDALYVVTRGAAAVRTDANSIYLGREFSLLPGDYFGEESLVADTLRNATVAMLDDGAVARLEREAFDQLVRPHLIREADDALMERTLVAESDDKLVVIDVRFPVEFRRDALPHCVNIPISLLRTRLHALDKRRQHLVTHHGGKRSELAVFLLRQAGFDAYLMAPSRHHFAHLGSVRAG